MATDTTPAGFEVADLPQGRLAYRAAGPASSSRPPVVFAHGILVDARLWEPVAERLAAEGIRSYAPTLPLGAHQWPMNADADLSPRGLAQLLRDFISALGLSGVTIVGNDTGGAICQVVLGGDTSRIGAAVLTNCDAVRRVPAPGPRTTLPRAAPSRAGRRPRPGAPVGKGAARPARLRAAVQRAARSGPHRQLDATAGQQGHPPRPRQFRARRQPAGAPRRRQPVRPVHRPRAESSGERTTRSSVPGWDSS